MADMLVIMGITLISITIFVGGAVILSYLGVNAGVDAITGVTNAVTLAIAPTQTLYLSHKLFPIRITPIVGFLGSPQMECVFLGTPQSNGTECISGVAIYPYNYTIQNFSSAPQTITFNPKEVATIYYAYVYYIPYNIPDGYTLLCPDIVNATK